MKGKVCIVTGSNTGIGKETARGLAQRGARVILACRDVGKAEAARKDIVATTGNNEVEVIPLDLASKASIRGFAARFAASHDRLDVLVNNAGLWPTTRGTTKDGLETTFGVNHVGTWLLTQELLPLLRRSAPARIVVLSSALHYRGKLDWDDLQFERRKYNPTAAYNQSKLANVLFTKALARRLAGSGVTVNAVHPGVVTTELFREYPKLLFKLMSLFLKTPEQGAACSLHVATAPELDGVSGEYFEKSRSIPAAAASMDEAAQDRLWTLTESLAAVTHS
jgi:NAD(P)-dependent dehydrogenase (short-subunit alcohol dehydrogenase family)